MVVKMFQLAVSFLALLIASPLVSGQQLEGRGVDKKSKDGHWIDTWGTMPQLTEPANLPPAPYVRYWSAIDIRVGLTMLM